MLWLAGAPATADPGVYDKLPPDVEVVAFSLGEFDGDGQKELAVLYRSGGHPGLALFHARSGRWEPWVEADGFSAANTFQVADVTGDGVDEILVYALPPGDSAMVTRVLSLDTGDADAPVLHPILEDRTAPPGYPLLGREDERPSVTFLQMGGSGSDGLRRVYCWDGKGFEKCVEVVWERP